MRLGETAAKRACAGLDRSLSPNGDEAILGMREQVLDRRLVAEFRYR